MSILWLVLWAVILMWAVLHILVMKRIDKVYQYRITLLDEIHEQALVDIQKEVDYLWRYETFAAVSFGKMMNPPWHPLPSYYSDHAFHTKEKE